MRLQTLVQAHLWEFRRNPMLLMSPLLMLFMSGLWRVMMPETDARELFSIMVLIMCAYMVGFQALAMAVAEEKEKRTLEALMLTPARPAEIFAAKVIVTTGISVVTALLCLAMWGLPPRLGVVAFAFLLAQLFALAGGFLMGIVVRDVKQTGMATPLWLLIFFTGFPPLANLYPKIWAAMAYLPSRPVLSMMTVGWTGAGQVAIRDVLVMLAYTVLLAWLAVRQLRKQALAR